MASCDICGQEALVRNIEGTRICKECFSTVQQVRNDDLDAIAKWYDNPPIEASEQGSEFLTNLIQGKEALLLSAREQAEIDSSPNILDYRVIRFYTEEHFIEIPTTLEKLRISYSDIIDYELLEDGAAIQEGGIGRAVVGGLIAGGAGAIVGSTTRKTKDFCTSLAIKITVRNRGAEYATFINSKINKNTLHYKTRYKAAQDAMSQLLLITRENSVNNETQNGYTSKADEILKLKKLLDAGAIDQDEFVSLKQELINS